MRIAAILAGVMIVSLARPTKADDWPQWMGPNRDSVWRETGIVERFPAEGLKVKWRVPVALGYAGPAVADGKVYLADYLRRTGEVTDNPGGRDKLEGTERLLCLDAKTGKQLWKHEYECTYNVSYPSGPRCTPTIDSGKVYSLGTEGDLVCLDASGGNLLWRKKLTEAYKVETPFWGFSAHPLIEGNLLYLVVGGEGSVAVALDKNSGREVWRALSAPEPGYCPPTMIEHAGTRQLVIWHPEGINSLDPRSGEAYWSIPLKPNYHMSIAAPRQQGDLLFASGIGHVGALMKLHGSKPSAEVVWRGTPKTAIYSSNSPVVIDGDVMYGADCHLGALVAARLSDGERLWEAYEPTTGGTRRGRHGTAFLVKHQDRFFLFSETGDLILARLSPEKYEELGRFHILEPTGTSFDRQVVWSHPAFAEKCVFARNDQELVCVSLAKEQ